MRKDAFLPFMDKYSELEMDTEKEFPCEKESVGKGHNTYGEPHAHSPHENALGQNEVSPLIHRKSMAVEHASLKDDVATSRNEMGDLSQEADKQGEEDDRLFLIALTMIDKVGPKMSRNLLQHFGSAKALFQASRSKLSRIAYVGDKLAKAVSSAEVLRKAERELKFIEKENIRVLTWQDEKYPAKLKEVDDAPLVLYIKGRIPAKDKPHIAIVGTRMPSQYGKRITHDFASYFAVRGLVVVSGLAYGIDMEAHMATMRAGGDTVAVLGHGLDLIYPKEHFSQAQEMVETGGALITEFCSHTPPDAFNFPARNRIISGLCDAVVVVEATEKGGALITAKMAFDQNRDVFAVPGCIGMETSLGCNRLIRDNIARIACGPEDIIDGLQHLIRYHADASHARKPKATLQLSIREQMICQTLADGPMDLDTIALHSGIFAVELRSLLLGLEFRHVVSREAGNKYAFTGE